jgi:transcriptional regulator with XRE-family HTH domain
MLGLQTSAVGTFFYVPDDNDTKTSAFVKARREILGLSFRQAAKRSEGAISHSHWTNLESGIYSWGRVELDTIIGMARALQMPADELVAVVRGQVSSDAISDKLFIRDVTSEYVYYKIVLLSYEGNEIGEKTVLVKREHTTAKLYGFTNQHNTVQGISIGQLVIIKSQKTFNTDDMVLVQAGGQTILAYALNEKASRVVTSQNLEMKTEKVLGLAVEVISSPDLFKRPRSN